MKPSVVRPLAVAGLVLAAAAAAVGVRAWLGERALAEARLLQTRGDILGATERFGVALRHGRPEAATDLARIALLRRRWDEAGTMARRSLALAPAAAGPHVILATLALVRPGDWDRAREDAVLDECRAAVRLAPMFSAVSRACGEAALGLVAARASSWPRERHDDVVEEAVARYARAVELAPRDTRRTLESALARGASPMFAVRAAAAGEGRAPLEQAVGLLLERGVWDRVAADYELAAELAGDVGRRSLAAAVALGRAGRAAEGATAARRAVAADPEDAGGWYELGRALKRAGRPEEGQDALRRAAELRPGDPAYRTAAGLPPQ